MTTSIELMACALPLLAEGGDDSYPYWFGGTCFLCRYRGALYAVTAEHCLRDKTKDEIRIQRRPDSPTFITLSSLATQNLESRNSDDPDQDHWAVFEALEPEPASDDLPVPALLLDRVRDAQLPPTGDHRFTVRGYPKEICRIDYEDLRIKWRAFCGTATYRGRPSWSRYCFTISLDDVSGVESIDGLSGSPVFLVNTASAPYVYSFAGIVLRGSKQSGLLHVLEARVVRAAVVAVHSQRPVRNC